MPVYVAGGICGRAPLLKSMLKDMVSVRLLVSFAFVMATFAN